MSALPEVIEAPPTVNGAGRGETETRATVTVTAIHARAGWQIRHSAEVLRVTRRAGRVVGSVRVAASGANDNVTARLRDAARGQLGLFDTELAERGGLAAQAVRVQSAQITAATLVPENGADDSAGRPRTALHMLVRGESGAGPLLSGYAEVGPHAGTNGSVSTGLVAGTGCASALIGIAQVIHDGWRSGADVPPWHHYRLMLSPYVAAPVIAGARMALSSPTAARLAGRRILPDLTLLDVPAVPPGHADDAGHPATVLRLVDRGVIVSPGRDPGTGLVAGRAAWDHDAQRLTVTSNYQLSLAGADGPVPRDTLELRWCVEGLRRFHPDGTVRMLCIAVHPATGQCFRVHLTARPLSLLRAVTAVTGVTAMTYTGDEVMTPSLLLPSVAELRNGGVYVGQI